MSYSYYMPTRILFGMGALKKLHRQSLPGRKALIVISSGKSIRDNGYLARVENELEMAGIKHLVYDKILANPVKGHVMEGAAVARENGCDFVIGLGGGSSMDSAKAIAVMAVNDGDWWDFVSDGSGKAMPIPNHALPIVEITTTAGTGSETDPWAVITNEELNEKIGFGNDSTFPVLSIVDPELMLTVPPKFTAYQGFDALFHATEGYINKKANMISDMFAIKAIELIGQNLAAAVANGNDMEAREKVALGNTLAGVVECNVGCTSEHSLEHVLSAYHPELPHGAGLIMVSKAYYLHFVEVHACDERFVEMAKAMGKTDAAEAMDFVHVLLELQKACSAEDLKMSDYAIKEEELAHLGKHARMTMGHLYNNDRVPLSDADAINILRLSYK